MADQVEQLSVSFQDDVSAAAKAAAASLKSVGDAATVTEERVTRASRTAAQLGAQFGDAERLTAKLDATTRRFGAALTDLEKSALGAADKEALRASILANQAIAVQKTTDAHARYIAAIRDANRATGEGVDSLNGLSGAHGAVGSSAAKMREGLVLVHEFIRGDYKRAVGSGMIELQNFGLMQKIVTASASPMGLALAASAVTVGVLTAAAVSFHESFNAVTLAVKATGDATGLTRGQLEQLAVSTAASTHLSVQGAREVQTALVSTGQVAGDTLVRLMALTEGFAKLTGVDAAEAAKTLGKAMEDPTASATALTKQYNLLDAAQLQAIKSAQESGNQAKAQGLLLDALQPRFQDAAKNIGLIAAAWHLVANAASNAIDKMGQIGKNNTLDQGIAAARAALANVPLGVPERAAAIQAQLDNMLEQQRRDQALIAQRQAQADAARQSIAAQGVIAQIDPNAGNKLTALQDQRSLVAGTDPNRLPGGAIDQKATVDALDHAIATLMTDQNKSAALWNIETQAAAMAATQGKRAAEIWAAGAKARIEDAGKEISFTQEQSDAEKAMAAQRLKFALEDATKGQAAQTAFEKRMGALNDEIDKLTQIGPVGVKSYAAVAAAGEHLTEAQTAQAQAATNVVEGFKSIIKAVDEYVAAADRVQKKQLGGQAGPLVQLAGLDATAQEALRVTGAEMLSLTAGTEKYTTAQAKLLELQGKVDAEGDAYATQLALFSEEQDKLTAGIIAKTAAAKADNTILQLEIDGTPKATSAIAQLKVAREQERIELERKIALKPVLDELRAAEAQQAQAERDADNAVDDATLRVINARIDTLNIVIDGLRSTRDAINTATDALSAAASQKPFLEAAKQQSDEASRAIVQPFRSAFSSIESGLEGALQSAFDNGTGKAFDFAATLRQIFIKLAADLAVIMVIKPTLAAGLSSLGVSGQAIQGLVGGAAGIGGSDSSGGAAQVIDSAGKVVGTIRTGSSGGGLGNLFGGGGGGSLFSGDGFLSANSINNFGVQNFGYPASGGVIAGDSLVPQAANETGALGGASLAGDLSSLAGTAASVVGAIGTVYAIYQVIDHPTVKTGLQAAAAIAAWIPVYGWIAAAVLTVASLVLPDPHHPDPGAFANVTLGPNGTTTPGTVYSANGTPTAGVSAYTGAVAAHAQDVGNRLGLDVSGITVGTGMTNRGESDYTKTHPNLMIQGQGMGEAIFDFHSDNAEEVDKAFAKFDQALIAGSKSISGATGDWLIAAAKSELLGTTGKELAQNIAFITNGYAEGLKTWSTTGNKALDELNANAKKVGQQAFDAIVKPMDEFNAKVLALGGDVTEAQKAQAEYVKSILGITAATGDATHVNSKYEQLVANNAAIFDAFRGSLERFGITGAQLDEQIKKSTALLDKQREAEIKATSNSLAGKGYLNDAQAIADGYTAMVQDAHATGGSIASANQLMLDQISHTFSGLTGAQIREVEGTFDGMAQSVKDIVIPALEALAKAADDAAAANAAAAAAAETKAVRDSHLNATGRGYVAQIDTITGAAAADINSGKHQIGDVISMLGDTIATTFSNLNGPQLHDLARVLNSIADTVQGPFADAMHTMAANVEATAHTIDVANMNAFNAGQVSRLNTAQGHGYLNDIKSMFDQYHTDMAAAPGAGSQQLVRDTFSAEMVAYLEKLTPDQLHDADVHGRGFDPLVDAALDTAEKFQADAKAADDEAKARQANIDSLQKQFATLTDRFNALGAAISSLDDAINQLTIGDLSPDGAFAKRAAALAIEQATAKAAAGGDLTAAGRLGSDVQNFLRASAAYQTIASTGYAADYAQGLGDLQGVRGSLAAQQAQTGGQLSGVRQQLHDLGVEGFASGGLASGWSMVGERGPELVNFAAPARVYTAGQTRAALGGGANGNDDQVALLRQVIAKLEQQIADGRVVAEATLAELRRLRAAVDELTREGERLRLDRPAA